MIQYKKINESFRNKCLPKETMKAKKDTIDKIEKYIEDSKI